MQISPGVGRPDCELDERAAEVFAYNRYLGAMSALCSTSLHAQNANGLRAIMENAKAEWVRCLRALDATL